jgi:hypothetical protein
MLHVLGDILLVTSADESRRQIVFCPPVYAAGLAVSPCGVTSADERRRQIVICPPFYAAGLAISPCGADLGFVIYKNAKMYTALANRNKKVS